MGALQQPFSNTQLEIIKAFSYQLEEQELDQFRKVIAQYFANRATALADEVWEKENWSDEKVDELLASKLRKSE